MLFVFCAVESKYQQHECCSANLKFHLCILRSIEEGLLFHYHNLWDWKLAKASPGDMGHCCFHGWNGNSGRFCRSVFLSSISYLSNYPSISILSNRGHPSRPGPNVWYTLIVHASRQVSQGYGNCFHWWNEYSSRFCTHPFPPPISLFLDKAFPGEAWANAMFLFGKIPCTWDAQMSWKHQPKFFTPAPLVCLENLEFDVWIFRSFTPFRALTSLSARHHLSHADV